jgi:hypothetical protein
VPSVFCNKKRERERERERFILPSYGPYPPKGVQEFDLRRLEVVANT